MEDVAARLAIATLNLHSKDGPPRRRWSNAPGKVCTVCGEDKHVVAGLDP
jgi:hypothetical protein